MPRHAPAISRAVVTGVLLLLSSCTEQPTGTGLGPGTRPGVPGLVEVTISGIGTESMNAVATQLPLGGDAGPRLDLSPVPGGVGDGTIQLEPVSTGSFTVGARGEGGQRYMYATFRVRNASSDGTPYVTPRENLTFLAVSTAGTVAGTAIADLRRFDGSPAASSLALEMLPTGAVEQDRSGAVSPRFPDVLQVFTEAEVTAFTAPPAVTSVLPYGFVASNPSSATDRTLPGEPAPSEFDGVVTFAFRVPL